MSLVLPDYVKEALQLIKSQGGEAYVVGGCVRDSLLGFNPSDWDITTDRLPSEIKAIFANYKIINNNGEKHGTVTVRLANHDIEITTYRQDASYLDGRHPSQVNFTRSLAADLARRDFTINALAYNEEEGLVDLYGGQADLAKQLIKTVGDPYKRFSEDYLRILRGVRFASKLGFKMEEKTFIASQKLAAKITEHVSGERIRTELEGILLGPNVLKSLLRYHTIICAIIPELKACYRFKQNNPYHVHDVYTHIAYVVSYTKPDFTLRLSALLHDIGKPQTYTYEYKQNRIWGHFYNHPQVSYTLAQGVCERLKLSNKEKEEVLYLVLNHDIPLEANKILIKQVLQKVPGQNFALFYKLLDLKLADRQDHINIPPLDIIGIKDIVDEIKQNKEALKVSDLALKGTDLIELGYTGKQIGSVLASLLEAVVEEKVNNDRTSLLNYLGGEKA